MKITVALCVVLLLACGGDDEPEATAVDPADFGVPEDAEATRIETPEGDVVFRVGNTLYGPCDVLEPHDGEYAEWLGIEPEAPVVEFGIACTRG